MKNQREGKINGYTFKRARLCDVLGVDSETWKWVLFEKTGEYIGNFATQREMKEYAAELCGRRHRHGQYKSSIEPEQFEDDAVEALAALKGSEL